MSGRFTLTDPNPSGSTRPIVRTSLLLRRDAASPKNRRRILPDFQGFQIHCTFRPSPAQTLTSCQEVMDLDSLASPTAVVQPRSDEALLHQIENPTARVTLA
jgi:hypothetical protein